ncbi:MAG: hypothetical protein ACJ8C4_08920 [Gemmataceae bacterium]
MNETIIVAMLLLPPTPAEPPPACAPCTQKMCVSEPMPRTKNCYSVKCEDYCLPRCSPWDFFRKDCGCDGNCGSVRTRKWLVKKKVPDCDGFKCTVKDVPLDCAPVAPMPAALPAPKK